MADLDQTQAINLDDLEDETDEDQDNRPVAHLKVPCQKGFPGRIFPLYEGDNLIGRQDTCNVCLPLKALSREHACIEIRGDNHMICDKNSRNRTRRGKMFLLPEVRYEIKHNDTLVFGDVNCVYLFGPRLSPAAFYTDPDLQVHNVLTDVGVYRLLGIFSRANNKETWHIRAIDGDDTGSETESDSMFQTVPDEVNDDEVSTDRIKVMISKDSADRKELLDHSDASSDMLEPSQPSIAVAKENRGLPGLFAVDMDSEQIWEKDQNLTVKETPAVGRTRTTFTDTLILPESESETEDELEKSDLLACPTLAMEENADTFPEPATRKILEASTQAYVTESDHDEEKDDSPISFTLLGAATQAYPDFEERSKVKSKHLRHQNLLNAATQAYTAVSDTDEESDSSEILCETTVTNIDAAMDLGPTQAYSSFEESSPSKLKKDGKERLIEKKDDGEKEEEELIIEEEEEEENELVKNLFMSPTLACDNEPSIPENEEESEKDFITGKSDDSNATQVFIEDEEESKKDSIIGKSDDNSATQVFIENEASTQALPSCDATKKVSVEEEEEATQVFEEGQATQIFAKGITCDGATQVFDDLPAKTKNQKADPEEDTTQVCTEDVPTLAVTDASLCVVEKISYKSRSRNLRNARSPKLKPNDTTLVLLENSITLPIPDGGDATVAVSEEATVAINEDEDISTHKGTILSSEDDATQVFTAEETFLLEMPDKPLSGRSSRTSGRVRQKKDPKVDGVVTGDCEGERSTRGKRGKRKKESSNEETVTQATEKVNDAHSAANTTTRKSGRKSTVAARKKSKGRTLAEEATQAYGKDDDEDEEEEEATEVPFSNLKQIENPREQVKENLSSDVKKNIEEFEPTQTFIMEVKEVEEPTQVFTLNATLNSPAFEPTHAYDMAVDEPPGEEATQAYADEKDHADAIKKIEKKEQPIRKSSRKSKGSAEAAGDVHASRRRNIETSNKVTKVENGLQTKEATQAYREDGDEDVYLPSLQEVIQKQDVKRNKRETSTAASRKRISRSQEKVAETPLRDKQGNKQDKDKESDLRSDLMNLPALKQAAPEATQAYGLDEDATPPLSADASSSPEAFLKSPVFPLPSTSPMKPALASSTRKKSPSPKCVTFAQEEKRENESSAVLKDKRTRRSLNMDLSKNKASVSIKKNRIGQMSKNNEESTDKTAVHGESVEEKKNVPKSNKKVRKSAAGLAVNKDQGECDKVAIAETNKRLKRGSLQPELAKTGLTSKRSRRSDPPPIVKLLQNFDSERRGVELQNSLSGELVVGDSKKKTARSKGKTKDNKDKGSIGDDTSNGTINQPTEIPDIEHDVVQEDIKTDSTRRSNRSQGKQLKDASALEPEALISNGVSNDRTTQRKITHEKLSNSLHENHSITENSSRKSIRGKRSGDTIQDTKTNSNRQDSIESQNSVAVLDKNAKTTRRRATIATGAAELDQNNQPADQFSQLKGRTTRQRVGQIDKTCKLEKITAPSPSHSKHKESGSISENTNYEEESSGSQEGPGITGERSRIKNGSKESKNTQQTRGRKRGSQEPTLQTPAKQAKAQDESFTPKGTREKEESGINSPSLRSTSVAPTKPKVMFTGLSDDQGEKVVKDLGGELASSVYTCTHLVTDKIRRTVKLLCCLGRGVPIVSQTWLNSSKQSGMFLDPVPFLLRDSATEKQYKFSLQLSLNKAGANLMLAGYKVHVTKNVKPEPQQMKDILMCAGAQYLASMPKSLDEKTIVISCDEDKAVCTPALNSEIPVVSAEFVLTGILRQEVDFNSIAGCRNSHIYCKAFVTGYLQYLTGTINCTEDMNKFLFESDLHPIYTLSRCCGWIKFCHLGDPFTSKFFYEQRFRLFAVPDSSRKRQTSVDTAAAKQNRR